MVSRRLVDQISQNIVGYMEQESDIAQNCPDTYFSVSQYGNLDNTMVHYETTAKEIWEQAKGTVTHFA